MLLLPSFGWQKFVFSSILQMPSNAKGQGDSVYLVCLGVAIIQGIRHSASTRDKHSHRTNMLHPALHRVNSSGGYHQAGRLGAATTVLRNIDLLIISPSDLSHFLTRPMTHTDRHTGSFSINGIKDHLF